MAKPTLSREALRGLLDYDPETGILTWKARPRDMFGSERIFLSWNARFSGKEALSVRHSEGYKQGSILSRVQYAHRIIWAWVHDEWPEEVDHINHDRSDNRLSNLRAVSRKENTKNKTGFSGQGVCLRGKRWRARIQHNGKSHYGTFDTRDEALAYRKELMARFGFHPNHGMTE